MAIRTIDDLDVASKRVLMRVDFNCPVADGKVTNDRRIVKALPTVRQVLGAGGRLILMSHFDRPSGKGFEEAFSLKPVAERLAELLGRPVTLGPPQVVSDALKRQVSALADGNVLLLENLRFCAGETMPDKAQDNPDGKLTADQQATLQAFVQALSQLADVYVNDAFGTCQRQHASMYGLPKALSEAGKPAVAGYLIQKEIEYLHDALTRPRRPFVAILGGVKVSDKIKLIALLLKKVNRILIGGAMAYTLLKASGRRVGNSRLEDNQLEAMKDLLAEDAHRILLPCDHVATDDFETGRAQPIPGEDIPDGLIGMDIGPKTAAAFAQVIAKARTIVWNGPMGLFEREPYAAGTRAVAEAVADATDAGSVSVIGGGDSATAVEQMHLDHRMTHVSTGGGAALAYLEGKPLPPLEVLDQK